MQCMVSGWTPICSTAHEWQFDSLWISHIMDIHEMLQFLEGIMSCMCLLLLYTLGHVVYLHHTGAAIQDKILFVIKVMAWLMCYAEMLVLTIKDHLYFEQFPQNRFGNPRNNQSIADLSDADVEEDMFGFSNQYVQVLIIHLQIPEMMVWVN